MIIHIQVINDTSYLAKQYKQVMIKLEIPVSSSSVSNETLSPHTSDFVPSVCSRRFLFTSGSVSVVFPPKLQIRVNYVVTRFIGKGIPRTEQAITLSHSRDTPQLDEKSLYD